MEDKTLSNLREASKRGPSKIEEIATALDYSTAATADWSLRHIVTNNPSHMHNAMYCAGLKDAFTLVLLHLQQEEECFEFCELLNGFRFSIVDELRRRGKEVDFPNIGTALI